jgi:penicillin-binding protein-related factor A (putative recombinase)
MRARRRIVVIETDLLALRASDERAEQAVAEIRAQQSERSKIGSRTEDYVENLHEACRLSKVAWVARVPTQFRVLGRARGGQMRGRFVKKATVDNVGWMLDGTARAVTVEVKHQEEGAFSLARVEEHQKAALESCNAAGGVSVLLVVTPTRTYAVPWTVAREHKTLNAEALEPHRVRVNEIAYLARFSRPTARAQPQPRPAGHDALPSPYSLVESWVKNARWFAERRVSDPYNTPALGLWMAARDLAERAGIRWPYGESFIEWFREQQSTRRES